VGKKTLHVALLVTSEQRQHYIP